MFTKWNGKQPLHSSEVFDSHRVMASQWILCMDVLLMEQLVSQKSLIRIVN